MDEWKYSSAYLEKDTIAFARQWGLGYTSYDVESKRVLLMVQQSKHRKDVMSTFEPPPQAYDINGVLASWVLKHERGKVGDDGKVIKGKGKGKDEKGKGKGKSYYKGY